MKRNSYFVSGTKNNFVRFILSRKEEFLFDYRYYFTIELVKRGKVALVDSVSQGFSGTFTFLQLKDFIRKFRFRMIDFGESQKFIYEFDRFFGAVEDWNGEISYNA